MESSLKNQVKTLQVYSGQYVPESSFTFSQQESVQYGTNKRNYSVSVEQNLCVPQLPVPYGAKESNVQHKTV